MLRQWSIVILGALFLLPPTFAQEPEAPANLTETPQAEAADSSSSVRDKASFLIGFNMITSMKNQGADLNIDKLFEGMRLADSGGELPMSVEEASSVIKAFERTVQERKRTETEASAKTNKAAGEAFLKQNATREGVKTLEDGIQYEVMTAGPGEGEFPKMVDFVKVNYKGTLTDGEQFDASKPGAPAEFPVGGVIRGFSSALTKMKVGDKWKVFIPSDLAYGMRGKPPIGPNSTLIFELELVEIVKKDVPDK